MIVYSSVLQFAATAACPPLSGLVYQTRVVVPESPPQAASSDAAVANTMADATALRRPVGLLRLTENPDSFIVRLQTVVW